MRGLPLVVVAVAAVSTAGAVPAAGAPLATQAPSVSYVALGDSYTAGPGIPRQTSSVCARSDRNYPSLLAEELGAAGFTDVSCSGARTDDLTGKQFGYVPPQLDALDPATTLVTLGIGGNDIGFGEIALTCGSLGRTDPAGSPCTRHYTRDGRDRIAERIAELRERLESVLHGVADRTSAAVYVVGYPRILPEEGSCVGPNMPIAAGDYAYLAAKTRELNAAMADAAADQDARYVDTYRPSEGHDVCADADERWVEGAKPTSPAAALHPNAEGMRGMADAVLAALAAG